MTRIFDAIRNPYVVLVWCLIFLGAHLFSSESWFKIWVQYRDLDKIQLSLRELKTKNTQLQDKLKHSQDLYYIEKQAKDRLGLLHGDEYVFLFDSSRD